MWKKFLNIEGEEYNKKNKKNNKNSTKSNFR